MTDLTPRRWVAATCVGWLLGFVFVLILSGSLESLGFANLQFFVGVGMALGVSLAQWWVLRKRGFDSSWILYATLGMGLPFMAIDFYYFNQTPTAGENHLGIGAASGALLSAVMQSMVLRKKSNVWRRWIVFSTLGWWLAVAAVLLINYTMKAIEDNWLGFFVNLLLILVGGPFLGLLTAGVIVKAAGK